MALEYEMKKIIITAALALTLCASALLVSCGGNTATNGNVDGGANETVTEAKSEMGTNTVKDDVERVIDDAERMMGDAYEHATHGIEDGTPGGNSARDFGGPRDRAFPRGK